VPTGAISSAAAAAAVSATAHDAPALASVSDPAQSGRRDRRRAEFATAESNGAATPATASEPRRRARWYWRLLAWIIAVPVGFVVTAWPAYHFKWIKKDDMLDVFVGSGNGRYTRLVVLTLAWALVTAVLVQLLVEGGRWLARRRRAHRAVKGGGNGRGGRRGADPRGPEAPSERQVSPPTKRPAASARR
jgi:hypothetical protein